jgi:hypothetical protein
MPAVHQSLIAEGVSHLNGAVKDLSEYTSRHTELTHLSQEKDGTVNLVNHQPRARDAEQHEQQKRAAELN